MILGGVLLGASAFWYHSRSYNASQLVQMLPPDRSSYVYIDVQALRSLGILDLLAGAKSVEEADYEKFVQNTGFDYRKDLDSVAVAFREGEVYYAAQGRFDWAKLEAYAPAQGGKCERFLCTVAGSEPGRNVTYYMPRNGVLGIGVSKTSTAGDMVAPGTWRDPPRIDDAGVWVSVLSGALPGLTAIPPVLHRWLTPLADTSSTIFTLSAAKNSTGDFELRLRATAKDEASAKRLAEIYTKMTDVKDLPSVLMSGKFSADKLEVSGTWSIPRASLLSLVK